MKNLLLLSFVVSFYGGVHAGVSREQMEKIANGFRNTCVGKVGVDMSIIEGIRDGKFIEDPLAKCYVKCVMGLMKTFTKQGTIDIEMLVKQINIMGSPEISAVMVDYARSCYAESSASDPCELAWIFVKCTHNKDPPSFFFP